MGSVSPPVYPKQPGFFHCSSESTHQMQPFDITYSESSAMCSMRAWQIHSISLRIQTCPYSRIDGLNMSQSHPQNRIQDVVPSFGSAWILKVWIPIQIAG